MAPLEGWELLVVRGGQQRHVVALQSYVADGDLGEELRDGLEHPEPGPKDGDGDQIGRDQPPGRPLQGCLDLDLHCGQLAHSFEHDQDGQALGQGPEDGRGRGDVSKTGQEMSGQWVIDHGQPHVGAMLAEPLDPVRPDPREYARRGGPQGGSSSCRCGLVTN